MAKYITSEVVKGLEERGYVEVSSFSTGNSPYSPNYSTFIKVEYADSPFSENASFDAKIVGEFPDRNPEDCYKGRTSWTTIRVVNPSNDGPYVVGSTSDAEATEKEFLRPIQIEPTLWLVDKRVIELRKKGLTQLLGDLF